MKLERQLDQARAANLIERIETTTSPKVRVFGNPFEGAPPEPEVRFRQVAPFQTSPIEKVKGKLEDDP